MIPQKFKIDQVKGHTFLKDYLNRPRKRHRSWDQQGRFRSRSQIYFADARKSRLNFTAFYTHPMPQGSKKLSR